jgi:hypothetical protein
MQPLNATGFCIMASLASLPAVVLDLILSHLDGDPPQYAQLLEITTIRTLQQASLRILYKTVDFNREYETWPLIRKKQSSLLLLLSR